MRIITLLCCGLVCTACHKASEPAPSQTESQAQPASNAPPAQANANANPPGAAQGTSAGGLHWTAPPELVARPPKSSMRVAEYSLQSDPRAELAVYYFGADQGGGVEANMSRWIGQFKQPDGSETQAKRSERKVNGIDVALVEAHGTYSGGMGMPGAPPPAAEPDAMLLGAIAQGPSGEVFFKFIGPRASVEAGRGAFDSLIGSIR